MKALLLLGRCFFMDKPLWGVRVQAPFGARVQKVQRVQRVEVGASNYRRRPLMKKPLQPPCGRGNAFPLWWLAPPPCPVGSMSLDSRVAGLPY